MIKSKWKDEFMNSIKYVEYDDEGRIIEIKGSFISRSTEDMN